MKDLKHRSLSSDHNSLSTICWYRFSSGFTPWNHRETVHLCQSAGGTGQHFQVMLWSSREKQFHDGHSHGYFVDPCMSTQRCMITEVGLPGGLLFLLQWELRCWNRANLSKRMKGLLDYLLELNVPLVPLSQRVRGDTANIEQLN